jgi:hypothetical protein
MNDYEFQKRYGLFEFNLKKAVFVLITCLVITILYDLKYRYIFWFNFSWYLFLLLLFSPIIIILSVSIDLLLSKRINLSKYTLVIPVAIILGFIGGNYISKYQGELSKEKIKPIIMALEQFNIKNGKYPEQLSDLVPIYLLNIPDSMMGWFDIPYQYHTKLNRSYIISFPFEEERSYILNSEWNRWYEDQQ